MLILKQPRPTGRATKSKKYHKNPNKNILGGVMRPKDQKQYRVNNNIKKPKKIALNGLISGFDMAFDNETDFKLWLNGFKNAIMRPTNTRHNINPIYRQNPIYQDKYISHFDIAVRDRCF